MISLLVCVPPPHPPFPPPLPPPRFSSSSSPCLLWSQDQFLRAAPVSGGVGELLMRKMGWRSGEGLGKHREGTVEPIIIDFKIDRRGVFMFVCLFVCVRAVDLILSF